MSVSGPFDRWPTGGGFDEFHGFMGAEMNHWYPQLFQGTTPVEPTRTPEEGYHLSEDLVDHAISWIHTQQTLTPDRPFFAYVAFGATHAPLHVAPQWRNRYAGRFDHGWEPAARADLARQREIGIVSPDAQLAPWADAVPGWDDLNDTERTVAARFMETYAGFAEHTDTQVGRLVDALAEVEALDNTLFVYLLGDNGASGEGGIEGTLREHLVGHGIADDTEDMAARLDAFGDATTYGIYPIGWALVMNTPYQWTKQVASHYGGTRDGLRSLGGPDRRPWRRPAPVAPRDRRTAHNFGGGGDPAPERMGGVAQTPIEGITINEPGAAERHPTQYFEMCSNRGIYHDGWTAVTRHGTPWVMVPMGLPAFEDDVWELYDTTTDWTQSVDLATSHPHKLRELQELFAVEAGKYQVFPLDDRVTERENPQLAGRPTPLAGRTSMTYRAGMGRITEEVTLNTKNRSHTITASV